MIHPNYTIGDIVEWVMEHRRNKVFRRMTKNEVLSRVSKSCEEGKIIIALNTSGSIEGIIIYEIPQERVLYILHLLAITKQAFKHFTWHYHQYFKGYTIAADRYDSFIKYKNAQRLINLIQKL